MFNHNTQYINIIKTQQNININYSIIKNDKIVKNEHSIFLLENNNLSIDTNYKLQTLSNDIAQTYICAICEDENQIIVSNNTSHSSSEKSILFDTNYNIILPISNIEACKKFYNNGNIDFLVSPFTILHNILTSNLKQNSLNLLILNNNIYAIILDEEKRYISSSIKQLTSFEDIKNSEFYNDDIVEQKLYEEIYNLELNENISNITTQFYEQNPNSSFIQSVNIYYNIKQLNDSQIDILKDNLMIDITYNSIELNDILFAITRKPSIKKHSFIHPRTKKQTLSLLSWIIIALATTIIAGGLFYILQAPQEEKKIVKKIDKKVIKKIEEIQLPNHSIINTNIINNLLDIFETISDNSVLKEIQLQKNESTLIYNFKQQDSYESILKPKLLKIYEKSENVLTSKNNSTYTAIISNTKPKKKIETKITKKYSISNKYLLKEEATKLLNSLFNKNTKLKYISTSLEKYTTYRYKISTIVKAPQEFFDIIDKINNMKYSIQLSYPIEFAKIKDGLEINLNIKISQNNPKVKKVLSN